MKATQTTHLFGISGMEEVLALRTLTNEVQEANKLVEDFDDSGCTDDEDTSLQDWRDEQEYLDDARQGAGYESAWAEF